MVVHETRDLVRGRVIEVSEPAIHEAMTAVSELIDVQRKEEPSMGLNESTQQLEHRSSVMGRKVRKHGEQADDVEALWLDRHWRCLCEQGAVAVVELVM